MRHSLRRALSLPAFGLTILLAGAAGFSGRSALAGDPMPPVPGGKPAEPPKPPDAPANPPVAPPVPPGNPPVVPPVNPPPPPPAPPPAKVSLNDAEIELGHLAEHLKNKKADTQDILGSLDTVSKLYSNLAPRMVKDPQGGADVADEKNFEAGKAEFQEKVVTQFMRALELTRVKPNSETNERDDVNVKAAQVLALCTENKVKVVKDLEKFIDSVIPANAKAYKIPTALYDEAFKTHCLFSDAKNGGFKYMEQWLVYNSTGDMPDRIKSALDGLVLMKEVEGSQRYDYVALMVKAYPSQENLAEHFKPGTKTASGGVVQNPKIIWEKLKPGVIKAFQYYCGAPKEKDGGLMSSAAKFEEWFRDHKNKKKEPWIDAKIVDAPPAPPANPPAANPPK